VTINSFRYLYIALTLCPFQGMAPRPTRVKWKETYPTMIFNGLEQDALLLQWRSQRLCVEGSPGAGGARVEALKAPRRVQRREGGWGLGRGVRSRP